MIMAKKFKDYYDLDCAKLIVGKILEVDNGFNEKGKELIPILKEIGKWGKYLVKED